MAQRDGSSNYDYEAHVLPFDPVVTHFATRDVRFPTSLDKTGSDAMNAAGDYSAAYCLLYISQTTSHGSLSNSSLVGHGMTFTIGRGTDVVCHAIPYFASLIVGKHLSELVRNFGDTWQMLVSDSQIRWIGPEKGVTQLALGAVVNAIWDLWAKVLGKPVWQVVAEMTPQELVRCVPFSYIEDLITPLEASNMLQHISPGKKDRVEDALRSKAVPAYTTSAGWLGYSEDKMKRLISETEKAGYRHFKLKVGGELENDRRRLRVAREIIGYNRGNVLMIDANQVWSVPKAIENMKALAEFEPWFIEEPTSPDDILGHATIRKALKPLGIGVATGEMCQNRILFKQMLQAQAIDVCQVDACRLGGLNEVLAVMLMCAKCGVPVVPHSGGVGLPEYTQHVSTIDYICISGRHSILEYVDSLHEHFLNPSRVENGYYITPKEPGYSVEMKSESMQRFEFPGKKGVSWWQSEEAECILRGERI